MNKPAAKMSNEFIEKLKAYSWKGNVRELKNTMERIALLSDNAILTIEDLPYEIKNNSPGKGSASSFNLATVEKEHIMKTLSHTRGNKTEAAHLPGIGLTTLYRKLDEYKIK